MRKTTPAAPGKRATGSDFFAVLAKHNQADITDLLADYFAEQP